MLRSKFAGALAIVLLVAFLYVLMRIAILPLESGEAYPAYSSLRADPRGTMALYESLAALSDLRVTRSFQPLPKLKGTTGTILLFGTRAGNAVAWSEEELKFYESLANSGARLVFAFLPEPPETPGERKSRRALVTPHMAKRWHISIDAYEGSEDVREKAGSMPRETWAYLEPEEASAWKVLSDNDQGDAVLVSHDFGKGQILLLTNSYPLSNEGLRANRDVQLIEMLNGPNKQIVFDESHLGVTNTGSVGALIRRYRLTGAFAVLFLLGLLFLWKNSTSLLPQVAEPQAAVAAGADAQTGLVNLLKRSVPTTQLARACWDRWKDTRSLGRPVSDKRIQLAERELATVAGPAVIYQKIQQILTEKT